VGVFYGQLAVFFKANWANCWGHVGCGQAAASREGRQWALEVSK